MTMLRLPTLEDLPPARPAFVAIGTFDGVHRGHRAVLSALVRQAGGAGALPVALTFRPHPLAVLRPDAVPPTLTTPDERARLIAALGVEALIELRFDAALAAVPAGRFVSGHLVGRAAHVFVGSNFTFGRGGLGRPADIERHLPVTVIPPVLVEGSPVSSTRVRAALQEGRTGLARRLLGRPYAVTGRVVPGDGRGRTIGFPTANVELDPELATPAVGVYAVATTVEGLGASPRPGVANLGFRPTFGGGAAPRLEVHLFDFQGDLYGRRAHVAFVRRLRGERRFSGVEALRRQIEADASRARRILGS